MTGVYNIGFSDNKVKVTEAYPSLNLCIITMLGTLKDEGKKMKKKKGREGKVAGE